MKKVLIGFTIFLSFTRAQAQTIYCHAQVLSTMCGSGVVNINIDTKNNTHRMTLGAVPCWGIDIETSGSVSESKSGYPFHGSKSYKLFVNSRNGEETEVARLTLQNEELLQLNSEQKPALLDIDKNNARRFSLYRHNFNLMCTKY